MEQMFEAHGGHRDRLRQRLLIEGTDAVEPHELVEFLLCYAIPRQDVNKLAHALLEHFGSMRRLIHATIEEMMEVEGMGLYAAQWLQLIGQYADACASVQPLDACSITNFAHIFRSARLAARRLTAPCCLQLCTDENGRLLYQRLISTSLKWAESECLRAGMEDALALNSRYAILILLAGRRVSYPSDYDIRNVQEYAQALNLADVSMLDMIILGSTGVTSMRRLNMIPEKFRRERRLALREDYDASIPSGEELRTLSFYRED